MAFDFEKQNEKWEAQDNIQATWPKGLLVFVFVLLVIITGVKFGFDFLNAKQLALINSLTDQVELAKASFPMENQKAILNFEKSVRNIGVVLGNKVKTSEFLTAIADNTHKGIYFTYLTSSVKDKNIEIGGIAQNFEVVSQAASAFGAIAGVDSVEIKNVRNYDSSVTFILSLIVSDTFFK